MRTLPLALLLAACKDAAPVDDSAPTHSDPPDPLAATACEAVLAGPAGGEEPAVELSRAHGALRLFSPAVDWLVADAALIAAIGGDTWDPVLALDAYADAVGACALDAAATPLPAGGVTPQGAWAVVRPGSGSLALPEGAEGVVLDLRGLPAGPEGRVALEAALALVLSGEHTLGEGQQRAFEGFPGAISDGGVYRSRLHTESWTVTGLLPAPLPLVLWTDAALSPDAARAAGALRLAGAAWLVGHPVWTQAAESAWAPVGERGLAWPARTLLWDDEPWPDQIPADVQTGSPEDTLGEPTALGSPPALTWEEPARPQMSRYTVAAGEPPDTLDWGSTRALLLITHGLLDRFFPYFEVVGRTHDDALLAELAAVDAQVPGDRAEAERALGRLMHAVQDGHGFFGDAAGSSGASLQLALQVDRLDGWPVVRASGHPEVNPGDTVIAIEGVPALDWYDDVMSWHSAATEGYLFEMGSREWLVTEDTRALTLRGVDGAEREVVLEGMSVADAQALVPWGGTYQASGWLDTLDAPELYLLNLNGEVTTTDAEWQAHLESAAGAAGLIVDMRDYPMVNHYPLAQALREDAFSSPIFRTRTWQGPEIETWSESSYSLSGTAAFTGPIVVLVSNKTVSAAENFVMMLWDAPHVTVLGQQSAGTNGNITGTWLPGQYYVYFTGMEVLNPDGSLHHGQGIPLDGVVVPTAEDFAAGRDPELLAAIAALQGA